MQQKAICDPILGLTDREMQILENSWAGEFSRTIFPAINEERFSILYSDNRATRPNTPVNVIFGALLIKEMMGLTDEELFEHITLSIQYQYALNTGSFVEQPISDRTLSRFRERVYKYEIETGRDLVKEEIMSLGEIISKRLGVTSKLQRVDSTMVSAACRRLARISIMHLTVRGMVKLIKDAGMDEEYGDIPGKYLKSTESDDIGYRLKGDEVRAKMEDILADALFILDHAMDSYGETDEYRRLRRMVDDQSKIGSEGKRILKEGKEILPTSMQTPYDEDSTYRKKSGKQNVGYVLDVVENCGEGANTIESYDLQPNIYSDEKFGEDVLNSKPDINQTDVILTDGAFCSTKTLEKAEEKDIILSASSMIGGVKDDFETGFDIDAENGEILRCPAGYEPQSSIYKNGKHTGYFDDMICEKCSYCDRCPGIFLKDTAKIEITDAALKKAEFCKNRDQNENMEYYANKRNGIEGVFSVLKRRYQIDHIPVRGLLRKKMWIGFKIGAMNIMNLVNT